MIPHFFEVESNVLYRSGRPQDDDDYQKLWQQGIRSIVNLEGDAIAAKEIDSISRVCPLMRWMPRPITLLEIYVDGYPFPLLENVVEWIDSDLPKPVLVHCQHGQDRTGLVVALWRVRNGWSGEEAYQEAKSYGFREYMDVGLDKAMQRIRAMKGNSHA